MKKVFPVIAGIALVVAAIVILPHYSTQAHAKEIVNDTVIKLSTLSEQDRAALDANIKADMNRILDEAKHASDLTVISEAAFKEEMNAQIPRGDGVVLDDHGDQVSPVFPAPQVSQYLRFTDPEGHIVTLGVDEHHLPIFVTVALSNQDVMYGMVQRSPDGTPGSGAKGKTIFTKELPAPTHE